GALGRGRGRVGGGAGGRRGLRLHVLLGGRGGVRRGVAEGDGLRERDGVRARRRRDLDAAALVVGPVDARRDEEEDFVGVADDGLALEEVAEHGEAAQARRPVLRLGLAVV